MAMDVGVGELAVSSWAIFLVLLFPALFWILTRGG
jgi:hypothetical protein